MSRYASISDLPAEYQAQAAAQIDVKLTKPRPQVTAEWWSMKDEPGSQVTAIRLTLQSPPSANKLYRNVEGKTLKSRAAREYVKSCKQDAIIQVNSQPLSGDVALTLRWYRPAKRGDLSNRIKIVEDALQGIAYINDSQVVELHVYRNDDKDNPRLEVEVEAI